MKVLSFATFSSTVLYQPSSCFCSSPLCFDFHFWTLRGWSFFLSFFGSLLFFLVTIWQNDFGFKSLDPSNVMASTDTETSEVCSPTGSILIIRELGGSRSASIQYPIGLADPETAPEEFIAEVEEESNLPAEGCSRRQHSNDWARWYTIDSALAKSISDGSDSPEYHTPKDRPSSLNTLEKSDVDYKETIVDRTPTPFHKWMRTLRRRAVRRQHTMTMDDLLFDPPSTNDLFLDTNKSGHHRQSSSGSSFRFVEAVKTASVSLASGSIFARSRQNSMRSSRTKTHTDRSSRVSISSNRGSEDSAGLDKPRVLDKAAVERSLQRRRILEELISTEEGYIGDIRFLINVGDLSTTIS